MTTILWYDNTLYADSKIEKNGEWFNALDKIHRIKEPFQIKSEKYNVDDIVLGWTCSGSMSASFGFVLRLMQSSKRSKKEDDTPDLDMILLYYLEIWRDNMGTIDNLFEVILIGAKSNYCYRFDPKPVKPEFRVYPHDMVWAMGTGAKFALEAAVDRYQDGLKGFLEAILKDPYSGGMFETWCLIQEQPEGGDEIALFQRVAIGEELSDGEIIEALNRDKDVTRVSNFVDKRLWTRLILAKAEEEAALQKSKSTVEGNSECPQKVSSPSTSRKSSRKSKVKLKTLPQNSK